MRSSFVSGLARGFILVLGAFLVTATICQAEPVIRIGALLDLSGPLSVQGAAAYRSIQYAVEDINLQGGIKGRRVEVVVFDTGADGAKVVSGAYQLIDEGVIVLIGPTAPSNCLNLRRIAENKKVPLILVAGTSPVLTFSGIKTRWTYSTTLNFAAELKALFSMFHRRGYSTMGVTVQAGSFYRELFLWVRGYAPEYGLRVTCAEGFNLNIEDVSRKISYINRCDPDVALIWANSQAKSLVCPLLNRVELPVALCHNLLDFGLPQDERDLDQLIFAAVPASLAPTGLKKGLSFSAKNFLSNWGSDFEAMSFDAQISAAQAWDATNVVALALRKGVGLSRNALRESLEKRVESYFGAIGKFSFDKRDHSGLDPNSLLLLRYFGGRWSWVR